MHQKDTTGLQYWTKCSAIGQLYHHHILYIIRQCIFWTIQIFVIQNAFLIQHSKTAFSLRMYLTTFSRPDRRINGAVTLLTGKFQQAAQKIEFYQPVIFQWTGRHQSNSKSDKQPIPLCDFTNQRHNPALLFSISSQI